MPIVEPGVIKFRALGHKGMDVGLSYGWPISILNTRLDGNLIFFNLFFYCLLLEQEFQGQQPYG